MAAADERVNQQLILLYLLRALPGLSSDELLNLAIRSMYLDYFSYAATLEHLLSQRYLSRSVRKNESGTDIDGKPLHRLDITPDGTHILDTLEPTLPLPIRKHLNQLIGESRGDREHSRETAARVETDLSGRSYVFLSLEEWDHSLLELKLELPNEQLAAEVAGRWTDKVTEIYPRLLALLSGATPDQDESASAD